jgi:hypothetical protein
MNKPYHERPDWILKSIVYFCDNYTIDGRDLSDIKAGAIATYRKHPKAWGEGDSPSIDDKIRWERSQQYEECPAFWVSLWYLQTGERRIYTDESDTECKPWTDYEKRKIAKLPRVK